MKKTLFVFTLTLLLFLVSCTSSGSSQPIGVSPFLGGTEALSLQFGDGTLREVYDGGRQDFSIHLILQNVGEYTISADDPTTGDFVKLYLLGFNPQELGAQESDLVQEVNEQLIGRTKTTSGEEIQGSTINVYFGPFRYIPDLAGSQQINYQVLACYTYETLATTQLCISGDPLSSDLDPNPVCKVNELKQVFNSAGPVQVLGLRERAGPNNKFYLDIDIGVVSVNPNLRIFDKEDDTCDFSTLNFENQNKVWVEILPLDNSDVNVECRFREGYASQGYVQLLTTQTGKTTLTCEVTASNLDENDIYQTSLRIKLRYAVGEKLQNTLTVLSVPNN